MQTTQKLSRQVQAFLTWLCVAFFFLYQYILRVAPGLIEPELRQAFSMTANDFSTLGSYFMFVYAFLQIPCGVLVDRFGVKKILLVSLLFCIAGNVQLMNGHNLWEAQVSRILMGIGSASAYISCLKVASDNFSQTSRGFFMGAALTLGLLGPLFVASPLIKLIETTGWHYAFTILSVVGVLLLFIFILIMPQVQTSFQVKLDFHEIKMSVRHILKTRPILAYAIMTICFYAPFAVIADLWGVAFLMKHFNFSRLNAATVTMQIYVGAATSGLILPWICEKYKLYNQGIVMSWIIMLFSILGLLYGGKMVEGRLVFIVMTIGIVSSSEILCFSAASHYTTPKTSGMILGVVNTFSVIGSAIIMQLVGCLLDICWDGQLDAQQLRIYTGEHYIFALSSVLFFVLIGGLIAYGLFRQGKKLHQQVSS